MEDGGRGGLRQIWVWSGALGEDLCLGKVDEDRFGVEIYWIYSRLN